MSNAIKELQTLHLQQQQSKYPNYPKGYFVTPTFDTKTANGLTKAIVNYIDLKGGCATRINVSGVYDQKLKKYRYGTTKKGFSDIQATYNGKALYVEVKIGKDKQSDYQKEFQKQITYSGGYYFIAKDFESFVYWFKETVIKKGVANG
jgi:hypothetical protein